MGNCQAAEAATVVIQHPNGNLERVYWNLKANEVMAANPGYYVAVVVTTMYSTSDSPVRHLKLLRPDDKLHIGHVYRLVSFEEVLREFGSRKRVRLSKLLMKQENRRKSNHHGERKAGGGEDGESGGGDSNQGNSSCSTMVEAKEEEEETHGVGSSNIDINSSGGIVSRHRQWRPTLQSIAEVGV